MKPHPLGTGRICQDDVDSSSWQPDKMNFASGEGKETLQLCFLLPSTGRHVRICDPIFYCSCRLNKATLFNSAVSHGKIYAIVPPVSAKWFLVFPCETVASQFFWITSQMYELLPIIITCNAYAHFASEILTKIIVKLEIFRSLSFVKLYERCWEL